MTRNASAKHMAAQQGSRVHIFDAARGFSVVSMVLFHYCYDLKFISGVPLEWFAPPLQDIWRASISWAFLFIAGCMCAHSRGNLRRGGIYMAFALLIFVVTTIAAVDVPISFGIIFCMAACTLLEWVLEKMRLSPNGYAAAVILFVVFLLLLLPAFPWRFQGPSMGRTTSLGWAFRDPPLRRGTTTPSSPTSSCT